MIDEAEKWARILKGLPAPRRKGDFSYSTEVFHLRPEIANAPIRNDRRYAVAALIAGIILILSAYGLFYFGTRDTSPLQHF